jgi:hypothetical protein
MRRYTITATTNSGGAATADSPLLSGKVHAIIYDKVDFADGVDFTITALATGETIWSESNVNADASCYPRVPTHTTARVAALYAAGGSAVLDKIGIGNDRVRVVIAQGGNVKTGTFYLLMDD